MDRRTHKLAALGLAIIAVIGVLLAFYRADTTTRGTSIPSAPERSCFNNLNQIGVALKAWSMDNRGQFPWGVSTNAGGTSEFCAPGADGVDANLARHFQVASNELITPLLLMCPHDKRKVAAKSFESLTLENITYQLYTRSNTSSSGPRRVMVVCPIDGNRLWSDGTLEGTKESAINNSLGHPMHIPGTTHD